MSEGSELERLRAENARLREELSGSVSREAAAAVVAAALLERGWLFSDGPVAFARVLAEANDNDWRAKAEDLLREAERAVGEC